MMMRALKPMLLLIALTGAGLMAGDELSQRVESALTRAGTNAGQLRQALETVPDSQREGMEFLIAYMPERDLRSLSAAFLEHTVQFAYQAWEESPWKDKLSPELFLNDVLPYASVNERRDDWREEFYQRFKPLVADCQTPGEAAVRLNQTIFPLLKVRFSRERPKADQGPYETIEAGMASCTGLSVLLIDACRAVGIPARFAGTPLWPDMSGNHSWVEVWDGDWLYTGGAEPNGDRLDQAWFTGKAATAQRDSRLHAIYATSYQPTEQTFPLVWDRKVDYVYAVNVTDRYAASRADKAVEPAATLAAVHFDVEASLYAADQLKSYLQIERADRKPLDDQPFVKVALTKKDAEQAQQLLWEDHIKALKATRAEEITARTLTMDTYSMPFFYRIFGDKPDDGRSLYISLHGGGGAPHAVNDSQWENQKKLYQVEEGVYLAPRAPTDTWNMWHQSHIDGLFDRLIEDLIVFEDVNPNRVYLLGYSAGGDGLYRLGPRMADRWAAASMMAGHPGDASPVNLYNTPFTIQVGGDDGAYNRNTVAREWGDKLDALQQEEPAGYLHWTEIYPNTGHWIDKGAAVALPWMAKYTRNPLPKRVIWRQDQHPRFYWLATRALQPGVIVRATLTGQQITLEPGDANELIIRVNDRMLNLDEEIVVKAGDKELIKTRVNRTIATLAKTLAERGDPDSVFSGELVISCQ